jgi:hypothetical protein
LVDSCPVLLRDTRKRTVAEAGVPSVPAHQYSVPF